MGAGSGAEADSGDGLPAHLGRSSLPIHRAALPDGKPHPDGDRLRVPDRAADPRDPLHGLRARAANGPVPSDHLALRAGATELSVHGDGPLPRAVPSAGASLPDGAEDDPSARLRSLRGSQLCAVLSRSLRPALWLGTTRLWLLRLPGPQGPPELGRVVAHPRGRGRRPTSQGTGAGLARSGPPLRESSSSIRSPCESCTHRAIAFSCRRMGKAQGQILKGKLP